jgi:hypothetical protein
LPDAPFAEDADQKCGGYALKRASSSHFGSNTPVCEWPISPPNRRSVESGRCVVRNADQAKQGDDTGNRVGAKRLLGDRRRSGSSLTLRWRGESPANSSLETPISM